MEPTSSGNTTVMAEVSSEEMLDRMLTRLALCDDSKLEALLAKLLPLVISSLSSQDHSVKNKVVEILSHVNKRVKHVPEIELPLMKLWELFCAESAPLIIKNFSIVYIEMAFDRADMKLKMSMAPVLLTNLRRASPQHQETILRISIKAIGECHATEIEEDIAEEYRKSMDKNDRALFLEFCLHLMLYQQQSQGVCSPGLSVAQCNRVCGKTVPKNDVLLIQKLGVLNVVESMDLLPDDVYPLYVAASADCQEAVATKGDELLKKKAFNADLDNPNVINKLFFLFNGSTTDNVSPENKVIPGSVGLKSKLMAIFCRSITAANSFPASLQCIFGCMFEHAGSGITLRLKQLGMEFTVWTFKHAKIDQIKVMGPVILSGIIKLLDNYSSSDTGTVARDIKTFAYQAIGLIAERLPHLFREKTDLAIRHFDSLQAEPQFLCSVILETTSSLANAYKGAPYSVSKDLESLLLKSCQEEKNEVRFCAMRWATALFDLHHCPTRFICMIGASDTRLDIREMAMDGLFPANNNGPLSPQEQKYPSLESMIGFIVNHHPELVQSSNLRQLKLPFPSKTHDAMIRFLVKCFEMEFKDESSAGKSHAFVSSAECLCSLIENSMAYDASMELQATASRTLITIGSYLPEMIESHYASRTSWLKELLGHIDLDTRESAAKLLGISCSSVSVETSSDIIREMISRITKRNAIRFELAHGSLCALGYVTADYVKKQAISDELLQEVLICLINVVNSETSLLASTAMQALGHIGLRIPLPVVDIKAKDHVLVILKERLSKLLHGDDVTAMQKIIISLAHMCVMEGASLPLIIALDLVFSLCRSKAEGLLFAAGEALSFLWGGVSVTSDMILKTNYSSLSKRLNFHRGDTNNLAKDGSPGYIGADDTYHETVRNAIWCKLFDAQLYSSRTDERRAGSVWLLSLTMNCGAHPSIKEKLPDIQEAFTHLLGDQNELTQEMASQGMSIVYELGDSDMKKNLVDAFVGTLTGSSKRKRVIKLSEDSEVFQSGSIGESPTGEKLTTYKELCSLANEMGQPDLIYKFMDLANYQASLNSKRGAAFGFSKIAKQAGGALQPHLKLLIPRLFKYQYDPDKNVQDAMTHIWRSLVVEPKKTIDEYFDLILDDLILQSGSRLWRSREASCLALSDIIQGRKFDQVGKHLKLLWTASFRCMDDIKETVRIAGDRLCRSVSSLTIRLCDISLTGLSDSNKSIEIVLPLLLNEGLLSKVGSIRKASVGVVMKVAKGAGVALRPHLPDLICCMLESLSSLEDQRLNYMELHAENVGIEAEKLENLRISISKGSSMWEILDRCIDVVDSESLNALVPRVSQLIRSGVGLNTRVGVASFICLLIQKIGADIKPFTNFLLKLLFSAVKNERSATAKRSFASACAMVLRHANQSQALKLIEDTTSMHAGDGNEQVSCVILLKSYASNASDLMSGYQALVLPIIFISRFDDDKNVASLYEELWEDSASGERITVQLYIAEIVSLVLPGLSSSSWSNKKKSALAICKLGEVLGESLSEFHQTLLESIMNELPGRLWEGKDSLLLALSALCSSCHKEITSQHPDLPFRILSLILSACAKKDKNYREAAFSSLEQVIKAFKNPKFFDVVFPMLLETCSSFENEAAKADDSLNSERKCMLAPHEKVVGCLKSCVQVADANDIKLHKNNLVLMLGTLLSQGQWTVKIAVFSTMKEVCSKSESLIEEIFEHTWPKIMECMKTVKIAQVHVGAAECLLHMITLRPSIVSNEVVQDGLRNLCLLEKSDAAKSSLNKCIHYF